jgi:hypothetical protein
MNGKVVIYQDAGCKIHGEFHQFSQPRIMVMVEKSESEDVKIEIKWNQSKVWPNTSTNSQQDTVVRQNDTYKLPNSTNNNDQVNLQ